MKLSMNKEIINKVAMKLHHSLNSELTINTDLTRILTEEWYDTDNAFFHLEKQIKDIIHEQKN